MRQQYYSSENRKISVPVVCGLIGYGALARQLVAQFAGEAIEWVVLVRQNRQESESHVRFVTQCDAFLSAQPQFIVEAASQQAVVAYLPAILAAGITTIVASGGALAEPALVEQIEAARRESGARVIIPSGAIGGLDYLNSIACLPDACVSYTSRKPVAAWHQELAERGKESALEEIVLFEGTAAAAARLYPKNLNAAFAIALTIHPTALTVRVIADPRVQGNVHEIEARSAAGEAYFRFSNAPSSDNPKSSMVTYLSLATNLRQLLSELRNM